VFFVRPKGEGGGEVVATAPWERVAAVVGGLLRPAGLYPERHLVEGFPSGEQLAALGRG
jgi:hypothetical protein